MIGRFALALGLTVTLTQTALSHVGVKDPDVKARMDLMVDLAAATKTLGQMARGQTEFDAATVQTALETLQDKSAAIPGAFISKASDPLTEARPNIWTDWDAFVAAGAALERATDAQVATTDDLKTTVRTVAKACSACHATYRAEGD